MSEFQKVQCTCAHGYTCRSMRDPNCCAHSCDYNDAVERIAELEREKAELVAQVEVLRLYAREVVCSMTEENRQELQDIMMLTPAQCLLQIQAEAGRAGFAAGSKAFGFNLKRLDELADEYAESIAKGE